MIRGIIVAVSANGVIGVGNKLPWHYSADLKRFKRLTVGHTIVMGRLTYESIGKALPERRNIVVTRNGLTAPGVEVVRSLSDAVKLAESTPYGKHLWFIGGARIFAEAMPMCDLLDVTYVPDVIAAADAVRMPPIDDNVWKIRQREALEEDPRLSHAVFEKR
ncbi:MAG: dihydrofolate reductase [Myxococcota bacterium]|nr:dihydrofolate reductase [Myxococcota bacterium]